MPVIFKILLSLALILVVQRVFKKLIIAVSAGTLLLAFWTGHSVRSFWEISAERFFSIDNYMLLLIIVLVIWLSTQMSKTGVMKDLVGAATGVFSKRAAMAVLPILVGLLPMPGGALFSAPLVDDCDDQNEVGPLHKTSINFWFRHVWEYWWPLYPGVIVAIDITGLDPLIFMTALFPLTLVSITVGYFFLLRKIEKGEKKKTKNYRAFFKPLLPVLVLIMVYAVIQFIFPVIKEISRYLPMVLAIVAAIISQQLMRPIKAKVWLKIVVSRKTFIMAGLVAIIRIYGAFIEAKIPGGDFLINQLRTEMASVGIPPLLLIIMLPFVAALTTGIAVGYAGASLPIVMQLIGTDSSTALIVSTAVLAYGSGYIGLLLSPVHVCLIVTNEHFKTSLLSSIRTMLLPAAVLFGWIYVWSILCRLIF